MAIMSIVQIKILHDFLENPEFDELRHYLLTNYLLIIIQYQLIKLHLISRLQILPIIAYILFITPCFTKI